jgi:hypothetical protein
MVQSVAPADIRAFTASLFLFVVNLVGLGVGPLAVGLISDTWAAQYGRDSLRIGLMIVPPVLLWGALLFEAAARCVAAELQLHARSGALEFQQSHRRHRVRIFDSRARTAPLLSILVNHWCSSM